MEEIRVQVLLTFDIVERKGKVANTQLLSGSIEYEDEPIELVSETVGDRWRVGLMSGFIDPPSSKPEENWKKGERLLWFVPHGELRKLLEGEIFRQASAEQ